MTPAAPLPGSGLTTTRSPFIEEARAGGRIYIHQPYELYSAENHETWGRLLDRMQDRWRRYASRRHLEGLARLRLSAGQIPRLEDVTRFMRPLTGFEARAVSGYVPSYVFFESLRRRAFPTTVTIRDAAQLDYLPEPDIFHDVAGHVPLHTDLAFAQALVRLGGCAAQAAERAARIADETERLKRLVGNIRGLARFFWFSVEFGLVREGGELKAYGSGLLSSPGELAHAIEGPEVERYPFQLAWVVNQFFEIDRYQPVLFIVDSLEHLYRLVGELEDWIADGRLDNVAPGQPEVRAEDLRGFLAAGAAGGGQGP
jgi:phenylalanine-4-hydroxylase